MLTPVVKALLLRTLPIDHIDADRIVLRGPVNRGADIAVVALAINPAFLTLLVLFVGSLVGPAAFGEALAEVHAPLLTLLPLILMSVLVTIATIILVRRRRTLRIALHRGQYLAHFYGPKGIDICLPLVHPFLFASAKDEENLPTHWNSPAEYKGRTNRRPWRRHLRLWPMGRIATLRLRFPDRDSIEIVPMPGAREEDFIACWEWLIQFIVPARASPRATPPGRVLRLAGAAKMLSEMSLDSFTNERLGLLWTTNVGGLLRSFAVTLIMLVCGLPVVFGSLGAFDGRIPIWVVLVCCPLSTAGILLLSLRVYPTVTTFTRGENGAYIQRLRGRERIAGFRIGSKHYDNMDQILMFTPRGTLRGRMLWINHKPIEDCALFIDEFCKPPVDTEGVDIEF